MADEDAVLQQVDVLAKCATQRLTRRAGGHAFRQPQCNRRQAGTTEKRQADKDRLPAKGADQYSAKHGCQNRSQAHDQHQLRKDLGRLDGIALVTDDCPRQHYPGTAAQRLNEARTNQPFKAWRKGAGYRGEHEHGNAEQQRNAPTEPVSHRTIGQLSQGKPKKVSREGQLNMFIVGPEIRGHGRKPRKIEVDGQRAEGTQ